MALTNELIAEFIEVTTDKVEKKTESTHFGIIVEYEGSKYVRLDGSDLLTPILQTTDAENEERVTVLIKDHKAIVTGNLSSPAARTEAVQQIGNRITEAEILIADKVSTKEFDAQNGRIDNLVSDNVLIKKQLTASEALIDELEADNVKINESLTAQQALIEEIDTQKLSATDADLKYATIEGLDATNADIHNLESDYGAFVELTTKNFDAANAAIGELNTNKLSANDADLRYANIDFSNIGKAAMEYLYTTSGLIENVIIGDATISGNLVGVTIKGDLIEGGTVIAEKLVIKGTDGLYYKLNTDGVKTETEQTEYNSLNGSVITAKSITATKISVDDLVAFDATIGGFNITEESIYSGVKSSVDNTTRGIYLDNDGQVAFGDSNNFLKFYKDENGVYKLVISADSIVFGTGKKSVEETVNEAIENANFGIQVVDGTFTQANCREGKSIHIFSEFGPKQDLTYGDPYLGGMGKNLMPVYSYDPITKNGITFERNKDGSLHFYGTATARADYSLVDRNYGFIPDAGTYTISMGTSFADTGVGIAVEYYDTIDKWGAAYGPVYVASGQRTYDFLEGKLLNSYLYVNAGYTVDLTFYPQLEKGSVATSYAPYINTPAIEGWTGLNAGACGKNLFSLRNLTNVKYAQVSPSVYDNEINLYVTGASGGFQQWYGYLDVPESWRGKTFTFSVGSFVNENTITTNPRAYAVELNGSGTETKTNAIYSPPGSVTFTISSDTTSMYFLFRADQNVAAEVGKNVWFGKIQLERGSAATSYEPYTGKTYALDFGKTVYGGNVNWNTGEMTVEWEQHTFDGSETVKTSGSGTVMYTPVNAPLKGFGNAISSHYTGMYCGSDVNIYNALTGTGYTTWSEFASAQNIAGTPVQLAWKLAEPYIIQLTPVQIETLKGVNTVYTDADNGRVEYGHDLVNVVNKVVTPTGYVFGEDGLLIDRPNTEMKTMITEDGMTVYKNDQPTLVANNAGVDAVNLHATTYLLIGKNSRVEDWNTNRTACFWIGE